MRAGEYPARIEAENRNRNKPTGRPLALPRGTAQRVKLIQPQQIRVDGRIRAREVRVIVGGTNEQLGVMKLPDALRKAQSMGLNLVEVAPTPCRPVCRIVDFGKYRYELAKQEKDKKTHGRQAEGSEVPREHRASTIT